MKKVFFFLTTFVVLTLLVLFSLVIPKAYHQLVHNHWSKKEIISQSIELNESTSLLQFQNKVKIKIDE